MVTSNARKHVIPSGADQSITRETIFEAFGNSIRDVVGVESATERAQLVTDLTAEGQGPTGSRPLVVHRSDAPGLHRIEYTVNGAVWLPASGDLQFASQAAADAFGTANGGLLSLGDRAVIAGKSFEWAGGAWRPLVKRAVFTLAVTGFGDSTLASTAITTTPKADETTDTSFITARTGTSCTVTAGTYLVAVHFELTGTSFSGRTFAEVAVGSTVVARNNSQHGVGENGAGVTAVAPVIADGTTLVARLFKTSGGNATLGGRLMIVKLD